MGFIQAGQQVHIPCQTEGCKNEIEVSTDAIQQNNTLDIHCNKCNKTRTLDCKKFLNDLEEQVAKELSKSFKLG